MSESLSTNLFGQQSGSSQELTYARPSQVPAKPYFLEKILRSENTQRTECRTIQSTPAMQQDEDRSSSGNLANSSWRFSSLSRALITFSSHSCAAVPTCPASSRMSSSSFFAFARISSSCSSNRTFASAPTYPPSIKSFFVRIRATFTAQD